jgi:chromate reductase
LLQAAVELAPEGMGVDTFDLADIPLYNADVEAEGDPSAVTALKQAVREADLVIIATPEYNQSVPAVTMNAIDWASRPPRPQAWDGKPVAVMGTSPGRLGTVSSQRALREVLAATAACVMPQPRMIVSGASGLFAEGVLVDAKTRERLEQFMSRAADWAARFQDAAS